jgi:hypothetical protein
MISARSGRLVRDPTSVPSAAIALLCASVVLHGCGPRSVRSCGNHRAKGSQAQLTIPVAATTGPRIDAPRTCRDNGPGGNGVFIAVRGAGSGRIALDPQEERTACKAPPSSGETCPIVSLTAFTDAVHAGMQARGLTTPSGPSLGVCGQLTTDFSGWNMSMMIWDWSAADAAIAAIHDELQRWGLASFGLSIADDDCIVPERARP